MARLVLARRARRELLELSWPLIDAIEDALGLLERYQRRFGISPEEATPRSH